MPWQIACGQWCVRVIIDKNKIGIRSWDQLPDRCIGKENICQGGIVVDGHFCHIVTVHSPRVAVMDFMHKVSGFPLLPHRVRKSIVSQTDSYASSQHRFNGCHADAIVHVRAWLVGKPRARFGKDLHLARIEMSSMCSDGFWS